MILAKNQVNWNQVFYFSEIASCGSIKDAAVKLKLTPPTLSEHVSQLERDLRVKLFIRQHRKLTLTAEGTRLYLRAKEMFEAGQRLIDVVTPVPLAHIPVTLALVPGPSLQIAYRFIGDFLEKSAPDAGLNLKVVHAKYSELEVGLSRAQFDFGFSDRISERKDLDYKLLCSSNIKFYVASQWAEMRFSELLEKLPLLICNSEPATKSVAESALHDAGLSANSVVNSDFPGVLVDLCERGLGIGVFSEEAMSQIKSLQTLRVPRDAPKLRDHIYAVWAKDSENREVIQHLRSLL